MDERATNVLRTLRIRQYRDAHGKCISCLARPKRRWASLMTSFLQSPLRQIGVHPIWGSVLEPPVRNIPYGRSIFLSTNRVGQ